MSDTLPETTEAGVVQNMFDISFEVHYKCETSFHCDVNFRTQAHYIMLKSNLMKQTLAFAETVFNKNTRSSFLKLNLHGKRLKQTCNTYYIKNHTCQK